MISPFRIAPLVLLTSLVAGCASGPTIEVKSVGALPAGAAYRLAEMAPGEPALNALVAARLEARGARPAANAPYLLQVTASERPGAVGLFTADNQPRRWLQAPDPRRKSKPVSELTLSLTEVATGAEVYRVSASERLPRRAEGDASARLVEAALADKPAR